MTVQPALMREHLRRLFELLNEAEAIRQVPAAARQTLHLLAVEHALQIAIQSILDMGQHVLAARAARVPDYKQVVPALANIGVFPAELATRLAGMSGFRNILVHLYLDVDETRVWEIVDERLDDLREAHAAFASLPELSRR